jgi:hypothetical protein
MNIIKDFLNKHSKPRYLIVFEKDTRVRLVINGRYIFLEVNQGAIDKVKIFNLKGNDKDVEIKENKYDKRRKGTD